MASIRKRGNAYRAEIARDGFRESKTFETRREAEDWAIERESAFMRGEIARSKQTLCDALDRIEPRHRVDRIRAGIARRYAWAAIPLASVTTQTLANWRDARLKEVAPGTVRREMTFLRGIFEQARREWEWIYKNPLKDVRRPPEPPARSRLISDDERDAIVKALNFDGEVRTVSHEVAVALLLALETAMRAGEIVGLTWDRVNLAKLFVRLEQTKNGDRREVALSSRAVGLLQIMRSRKLLHIRAPVDPGKVFHIDSASLDTLFRRARDNVGLEGLTFHDSRATAITRLSKVLDIHDLARMSGHRDLNSLLTYYRATASEIAARLG